MRPFRYSILFVAFAAFLLVPHVAFAETTLQEIFIHVGELIKAATPIVAGLALATFFWGLAMYLFSVGGGQESSGGSSSKRDGRAIMITGIIVMFVIVSIWGIVTMLQVSFGINPNAAVKVPIINDENPY